MDVFAAMTQNLPEMLARGLAEQKNAFRAMTSTAGPPAVEPGYQAQPPVVPNRNPGRVATRRLHHAAPETVSCPSRKNSMDTAWRNEREAVLIDAVSRHASFRTKGQIHSPEDLPMKQENDKDERRLFLNGLDEDWRSDSSADVEPWTSARSVRTRQQSFTTAATSVDAHIVTEGKAVGGCGLVVGGSEKQAALSAGKKGESWVDLEPEMPKRVEDRGRDIESSMAFEKLDEGCHGQSAVFEMEGDKPEQPHQTLIRVPRRRSSLSHQVGIMSETAHVCQAGTHNFTEQLASQLLPPSTPQYFPHDAPSHFSSPSHLDDNTAAFSPVVPTGPHRSRHNFHLDHLQVSADHLLLPPLPVRGTTHHDAPPSLRSQQQLPDVLSTPRKSTSQIDNKMPLLTSVHCWLESSGGGRPRSPPLIPTSPVSVSPTSNMRVSVEVLNSLRVSIVNFPDTMLLTSNLTVETIRSYSQKLKRGNGMERASAADNAFQSPSSPQLRTLRRKTSLGNMSLMSSLRGKFSRHQSATSTLQEDDEAWIPNDRSESPPTRTGTRHVAALRTIFPQGTAFLLDALYAHIIVYNYVDLLCGDLPHLQQTSEGPHLRVQPSKSFVLPAGVTSLADLRCQPDVSETVVRDFKADVKTINSKSIVPSKAAAMLGIGSTNMGKPTKPRAGETKIRKAMTPRAALFSNGIESGSAMRQLRNEIRHNIRRLVETVEGAKLSDEDDELNIAEAPDVKEENDLAMRCMFELVRCYEALHG